MKSKRYNIDDVGYCNMNHIPDNCAFCDNTPIAILKIRKIFFLRSYWICDECRHKWTRGELII